MFGRRATKEKQRLYDLLATLDPKSPEYGKVSSEIEKISRAEAAENSSLWPNFFSVINTAVTCITSGVQVHSVLKHEDRGNIVTTKSLNYAQKLPNPNQGPKK